MLRKSVIHTIGEDTRVSRTKKTGGFSEKFLRGIGEAWKLRKEKSASVETSVSSLCFVHYVFCKRGRA